MTNTNEKKEEKKFEDRITKSLKRHNIKCRNTTDAQIKEKKKLKYTNELRR
jgi:hypothetical protein